MPIDPAAALEISNLIYRYAELIDAGDFAGVGALFADCAVTTDLSEEVRFGAALAVGMAGYIYLGKMSTVDAFLNAAMILSGMGPVGDLPSDAAKIFAGLYAIYSGIIIIATAGVLLAPALHRMLHRFHMADESEADAADKRRKR